ncbi:peptidyl-prolyl cis-trans isomerase 5-like [Amphiura filiformis]|uniref:peptidyl-prolyl cis-trans isomerase 5-like n=1 Tax=Amphiura filiformis TaxID=82378 RepID=UPI003B21D2AE
MESTALVLFFAAMVTSVGAYAMASHAAGESVLVTNEVFFDISIDGNPVGKIIFGLFNKVAPKTVENFLYFSAQQTPGKGYKGSIIHRVVKGYVLQGGDFLKGDGTGETSKFGDLFEDESLSLRHTGAGWLGMANKGADTNSCQFFITFVESPWLDGKHVIFGKVLVGMDVARAIENVETDEKQRPIQEVRITGCGEILVNKPFNVDTRTGSKEL